MPVGERDVSVALSPFVVAVVVFVVSPVVPLFFFKILSFYLMHW